jgi:plastocyanin
MKRTLVCLRLLVASAGFAILSSNSGFAATASVNISNFAFDPKDVTVNVGDTVTWTQKDTTPHTTTSDDAVWDSPFLSVGQSFSRVFDVPGSFPYHCKPHPFMTGTVTVQGAPADQPPLVTITSPSDGSTFTDPNVTLEATASDVDGSVAKVEFFDGQTSLGGTNLSPYRITVVLALGPHTITAQATDDQGATTVSTPVQVQINNPAVAPSLSDPAWTADGKFQFTVHGAAGQTYIVQTSADAKTWNPGQTVQATSDEFTVTETPPADASLQFYRVQLKP